jgi:hypothetical protein
VAQLTLPTGERERARRVGSNWAFCAASIYSGYIPFECNGPYYSIIATHFLRNAILKETSVAARLEHCVAIKGDVDDCNWHVCTLLSSKAAMHTF